MPKKPVHSNRRWPRVWIPNRPRTVEADSEGPQASAEAEALRQQFNPVWYLETYPDVATAGIDPLTHFIRHGQHEGRLPGPNRALVWDHHLWRGAEVMLLPRLFALLEDDGSPWERSHAAWALGRWFAWQGDWHRVNQVMWSFNISKGTSPAHVGPQLLRLEALRQDGQTTEAAILLDDLLAQNPEHPDLLLARANLTAAPAPAKTSSHDAQQATLEYINRIFGNAGLEPIAFTNTQQREPFDRLVAAATSGPRHAEGGRTLVSVIVPVFNAAETVTTALHSLCQQTWPPLEILVVNDASTDATQQVLENFLRQNPLRPGVTIRLLRHTENRGAYAARNTGLAAATGDLITTHDADDWSHPQKIERQAQALCDDPALRASLSHWVRCTSNLHFHRWRIEEGWIHRNVSSLMFRRCVFDTLGYWDCVNVNADTEYYYRLQAAFGAAAMREMAPGVPLAFGRSLSGSLSHRDQTSLRTRFIGPRKDYEDAAQRWHRSARRPQDLYLEAEPAQRPFLAPAPLLRNRTPVRSPNPMDIVQQSGLFDAGWYVRSYADLQDQLLDVFEHYWLHGSTEGRDPGPNFSTSGYRARYAQQPEYEDPPLLHYLRRGKACGNEPMPFFSGALAGQKNQPTILVCAHQAGTQIYGAERSLLDVLTALRQLNMRAVVTLPGATNIEYLAAVRDRSAAAVVLPYQWWHAHRPACTATRLHFEQLIRRFHAKALYANTLVLDEPLLAARATGIPALVHVRELPSHDAALCEILGAPPEQIVHRIQKHATLIIANSERVASDYPSLPITIIPNTIDPGAYALPAQDRPQHGRLRSRKPVCSIALISSNIPKKGLDDFVEVARRLADHRHVRFLLIGPENEHTARLQAARNEGKVPRGLVIAGYAATPQQALVQADVVLNLSHFQESFGRTVLEAMAAGRPVVCYAWGALPELVVDGETGYLVPFRDVAAAAERVVQLAGDRALRKRMGKAAQERAARRYGPENLTDKLSDALGKVAVSRS